MVVAVWRSGAAGLIWDLDDEIDEALYYAVEQGIFWENAQWSLWPQPQSNSQHRAMIGRTPDSPPPSLSKKIY